MKGATSLTPVQTAGDVHWHALPEVHDVLFGPNGLRLDEWQAAGQATVVKHGPHRTVYRVELLELSFYVKQYRLADTRAWLREWVRPSKARVEQRHIEAVAGCGVATVTTLAVGEQRGRFTPGESFLITRSLGAVEPLGGFLDRIFGSSGGKSETSLLSDCGSLPLTLQPGELEQVSPGQHPGTTQPATDEALKGRNRLEPLALPTSASPCTALTGLEWAIPSPLPRALPWAGMSRPFGAGGRERVRLRQRLAIALGELLARMHDAGIRHQDLHAGNLLIRLDEDNRPQLFLIDLHAVKLGRSLGWAASVGNLVLLNRWFTLRASRSDRLRFWHAYCRTRRRVATLTREQVDCLARTLEQRTWQSNLGFWKHRDRRCLLTNRYYRRFRSPHVLGHAVTDLDSTVLAPLLADPDAPFRRPGVRLLKDSRSSTVAEIDLPVAGRMRRVVYKRFRVTTWSDPWTALVRRSPALRSWVHGHGLRERLLPTPRPLAVLHRRRRGLNYEGYLLTEKVEDAVDLHTFVAGLVGCVPAESRRILRCCIEDVARLVRELHRRRLLHRDLKAANILVSPSQNSTNPPTVSLIDLVGVTRPRKSRRQQRVRNLARLHVSFCQHPGITRTDKLRFLRVYLQWGIFGRERWKRWWRRIESATQAKVARNARRGRPLA